MILTLTELKNPSLPDYWLFVFKAEQSQGEESYTYRIQLTNVSASVVRYDEFILTEGTDLTFHLTGDYSYSCYQMPNDTSLDEVIGHFVEGGKMRLIEVDDAIPTFTYNPDIYINGAE